MPRKKVGRRTKYTPETVAKLTQAIRLGMTHLLACQYAGISHDTFYTWMNKHPEFSDAIKEAEGEGAVELLAIIKKQAREGTWQAAAWILERRHPEAYGRQRVEHTGANGQPIAVTWESLFTDADGDKTE